MISVVDLLFDVALVAATISAAITRTNPAVSISAGTWPSTGQAISAAKPGASAGKTAAREGPSKDTIFE
ncbi:MAG: hypothetical protein EB117_00610 [Betaproteobacteria bacterium]|nr:hypothetical protein [Betaproteobacteria bacterium]